MRSKSIIGLDLIRFMAAFMVLWCHLGYFSWAPYASVAREVTGGIVRFPELAPTAWFGWIGVQIFFVLSGFVIANSSEGSSPAEFVKRRILRLLPAAWICGTATALLLLGMAFMPTGDVLLRYLRTLTFWPVGPWVDGVYWTLAIEIVFYGIVWALLLIGRFDRLPAVIGAIGSASALYWLLTTSYWLLTGTRTLPFLGLLSERTLSLFLIHHGCYFAVGVLLWVALVKTSQLWLWLVIALCVTGGVLEIVHLSLPRSSGVGGGFLAIIPVAVWLLSIAAIAAAVRWNDVLVRLVRPMRARRIGLATYPLYLLHNAVGAAIMLGTYQLTGQRWTSLAAAILAIMVLSWLVAVRGEERVKQVLEAAIFHPLKRRVRI
jgi:peptidoglycan/LPS O-acetylase OafA/YrhL